MEVSIAPQDTGRVVDARMRGIDVPGRDGLGCGHRDGRAFARFDAPILLQPPRGPRGWADSTRPGAATRRSSLESDPGRVTRLRARPRRSRPGTGAPAPECTVRSPQRGYRVRDPRNRSSRRLRTNRRCPAPCRPAGRGVRRSRVAPKPWLETRDPLMSTPAGSTLLIARRAVPRTATVPSGLTVGTIPCSPSRDSLYLPCRSGNRPAETGSHSPASPAN